jgi:hypothetical protein
MSLMIMNKPFQWLLLAGLNAVAINAVQAQGFQYKGAIQASWQSSSEHAAWYNRGVAVNRFGTESERVNLSRGVLDLRTELGSKWSLLASAQYVPDPDSKLGFTELFAQYHTLNKGPWQWQGRVGGFYPRMSLENPDIGWSSPYNYSYSAINAWLGEEIRTFGTEVSFKRSDSRLPRRQRSGHNWELVGALYKGNDPAGTLLAWRGWAVHDRQSVFNEAIAFAPINALNAPPLAKQAWRTEPFTEVDGRFGYYLGAHWDYQKRHTVRLYWYDNNGDPSVLNYHTGQYAWDTKFYSAAYRYKITHATHLIMQAMAGNTAMGVKRGVDNDFSSQFVLLTHKWQDYRISGRLEQFDVKDRDFWEFDPNTSEGGAITVTGRWQVSERWHVGMEFQYLESKVANRADFNLPTRQIEQLWRVSGELRF